MENKKRIAKLSFIETIDESAINAINKAYKLTTDQVIDMFRASAKKARVPIGRKKVDKLNNAYKWLSTGYNKSIQDARDEINTKMSAIEKIKTSGFGAKVKARVGLMKDVVFDYTSGKWKTDDDREKLVNKLLKITPKLKNQFYFQLTYDGSNIVKSDVYSFDKDSGRDYYTKMLFILSLLSSGSGSDISLIYEGGNDFRSARFIILNQSDVDPKKIEQYFLDGDVHCVFSPIKTMFQKMITQSSSKEVIKKYQRTIHKLDEYEKQYDKGVPEDQMEEIAKTISHKIILHDLIGNVINIYNSKAQRILHLTNNRKHHVESGFVTLNSNYESVSSEEIFKHAKHPLAIISGDWRNPQSVQTPEGAFALFNEKRELFKGFSDKIGIKNYSINAVKHAKLNKFLKESRIINSAPVSLNNDPNHIDHDLIHIDIEKAYTQHKKCNYYQGFLGKIHHFVNGNFTSDFIKKHVGVYKFMVYSCKNQLLHTLGIRENNEYLLPSPEILMLIDMGCDVGIFSGAFGSTFDFDYTDEMLEDRNYCTWAGKLGLDKPDNYYTFKADKEWAGHLKHELGESNVLYYAKEEMIRVRVPKKSYTTNHHILSFITSYTRINMISLMNSIDGELVKVILDGIYFRGNISDEVNIPYKRKETKIHNGFASGWYFGCDIDTSDLPQFDPRFDGNCVLAGSGGSGKTHSVLNYEGFLDVLYVVPTNQLGMKQKVQYTTIHRLVGIECQAYHTMYKMPSVILIDELTMIEKTWIESAIKMYPESLILIAGDIDKRQWFQTRNGKPGKFSEIWRPTDWRYVFYETDYRAKCGKLKQLKTDIRNEMRNVFTDGGNIDTAKMNHYITSNYKTYTFEEGVSMFSDGDIWICGTHKTEAKLKEKNIVSTYEDDKKTCFTIHSFQGLTISDQRVFISLDLFEYAMLYTAISRVCHFSQLIFIK
jgi:hypothetical protein